MAEAGRTRHSLQFQYSDPLSREATSRTTRYRILKKRKHDSRYEHQEECDKELELSDTDDLRGFFTDLDEEESSTHLTDQPTTSNERSVADHAAVSEQHVDTHCTSNVEESDDEDPLTELLPEEPQMELSLLDNDDNGESIASGDQQSSSSSSDVPTSSILVMQYSVRHNLTQEALSDLLQLLKFCGPAATEVPTTVYKFKQQFKFLNSPPTFHYFCSMCMVVLTSNVLTLCPNDACKCNLTSRGSISSFIETDFESQLTRLLQRKLVIKYTDNRYMFVRASVYGLTLLLSLSELK